MKKRPIQSPPGQQPVHSRSFMLRLWCADEHQTGVWHASLEDPFTGERVGFCCLEQLFAFLMELSERASGLSGEISNGEGMSAK